jgi:ribonuclease P protein component
VAKASSEENPHKVRIVRSSDYRMMYKAGNKAHSERFVLFWKKNGIGHHRLGITVSRKVGNSVIRNRIKRLFREIFRKTFRRIPGQFDLVINVKQNCDGAKYDELHAELLNAIQRIGPNK